ncbi:hypothetical protein GGX14DRAFT_694615 [Mycena pura]|uniref:Uncharacterized protein n=1 Tax=Mycena pura TaxID=153505 RepID=A0AAD6YL88_9AGAR|nr:hypothetical protein GGX14DRAFT_694615 [Mycena pura]
MVRQDYYNILVASLWFLFRKREAAPESMKKTFPETRNDVGMDVDCAPQEQINVPPHQEYSPGIDELCIPERMPNISEATTFPNPFLDRHQGNMYRERGAIVIAGLPGIGKTAFLAVIFWLRVAAKLLTAYMANPNSILVYDGDKFFVFAGPTRVSAVVSKTAWFLVDSSTTQSQPPQEVIDGNFFIVQAGTHRTEWVTKNAGSVLRQFCIMQPWTIEELFAGFSLQYELRTGAHMYTFFKRFGGSARHVYDSSPQFDKFDNQVKNAAAKLTDKTETIIRVMEVEAPVSIIEDSVSHMLVAPLPFKEKDRTQFRMTAPSEYLQDLFMKQLDSNYDLARRLLYTINVGVGTPGSKASVADMLHKHHHWFIGEGGKWHLREFKKSPLAHSGAKTNLWRVQANDCDKILVANGQMSLQNTSEKLKRRKKFTALTVVRTLTSELKTIYKHQFYRPCESNFPTFDSFYLDKDDHAFVFQASEADKKHTVHDNDRLLLEKHGVKTFTYIHVSGPRMDTLPTIALPVDTEGKFPHIYHLILDYPDIRYSLFKSRKG